MTLTEFKAFLEGLDHGFQGAAPSPEQWQLIKDKLNQVQADTVTIGKRDIIGPDRIDPWKMTYWDFAPQCGKKDISPKRIFEDGCREI